MNSGSSVNLVAELPLLWIAIGAVALPCFILWIDYRITHRTPSPLAQGVVIITCATGCIILLTFSAAFLPPGSFDARSAAIGPFTFDARGQAATLLVATVSIFGVTAVIVNFVYKHIPAPPPTPVQPEDPLISIKARTRRPRSPQTPTGLLAGEQAPDNRQVPPT